MTQKLKRVVTRLQQSRLPTLAEPPISKKSTKFFEPTQSENPGARFSKLELELYSLFKFKMTFLLDYPDLEDRFNALSRTNKVLVGLFLRNRYSTLEGTVQPDTFQDFQKLLKTHKTKKRNEEKFKMVYRCALKVLQKRFDLRSTEFMQSYEENLDFRKFLRHEKSTFYLHLFEETIRGDDIHEDLLMDILFEKATIKRPQMQEKNNWVWKENRNAMLKISAAIRYVFKNDRFARRKFLEFADDRGAKGLIRTRKTSFWANYRKWKNPV